MSTWLSRAVLIPVAFLATAELVCRFALPDDFVGRFDYGYLPQAGFVDLGDHVEVRRTGGRKFYPQSFTQPKPAGRTRIFAVGDSITRGDALADAYPAQLQALLAARGIDAEALNLGVTAYGARRKRVVLEQVLHYQPDLIVLEANIGNEGYDERDWNRAQQAQSWHPRNWFMKSYALRRLYEAKTERLFNKLPQPVRAMQSVRDPDAEFAAAQKKPEVEARWRTLAEDETRASVDAARGAHVPLIIVTVAGYDPDHGTLNDYGLDDFTRGLAGDGVRVLTVREIFAGHDYAKLFTGDNFHWTAAGHLLVAEALAPLAPPLAYPSPARGEGKN